MTRRVVKVRFRDGEAGYNIITKAHTGEFCYLEVYDDWEEEVRRLGAPYQPGDILYVRETWYYEWHMHDRTEGEPDLPGGKYSQRFIFKADQPDYPVDIGVGRHGWRPAIHMPKEAARIFLRVKGVRAERLQEITEDGAVAEGILPKGGNFAIDDFESLWDSTIKPKDRDKYGWEANPWVWVIEFERVDKPEGWPEV